MYKNIHSEIKKYKLDDPGLHRLHKEGEEKSDFGMDNTGELIDGGFALYSSADLKKNIGPVKTEYFRIGLMRKGTVRFGIGLETFAAIRNNMIFGFPGQIFSLSNLSKDFYCYYMLFSEEFMVETLLMKNNRSRFPFFTYYGKQCLQLPEEEANGIEKIILQINDEIKMRKPEMSKAIQLYIQLILIKVSRNYSQDIFAKQVTNENENPLFGRFVKLVSEHFLTLRKVSDYAGLLHVSSDHLNRIIKNQSNKTAHELIDEMILMEAKALLLHSKLSIAEIAYKLEFADPSHFNKFFKKLANCTPLQYKEKSV